MEKQSMRAYLDYLKKQNKIWECKKEVDPKYELGALLREKNGCQPMFFPKIRGYKDPVVGGLYGSRDLVASYFGCGHKDLKFKIMEAMASPGSVKEIVSAPVKDNVVKRNIDICNKFPVPFFHEKDSGRFITAGMVVVRDEKTGQIHSSVRRLQVFASDCMSVLIESPRLLNQFFEYEKEERDLEIAVVLGYDPAYLLGSQVKSDVYGLDKNEVTSALHGEPFEVVRCNTIDITVPANSEIVFEGRMLAGKREKEGPFGEMAQYYGPQTPQPYMKVESIMHRNNPIFQVIFPSSAEHVQANGFLREVGLYTHLKTIVDVKEVHLTTISGCRYHAFASINKKAEGEGKSAIMAALASNKDVKHVVIVDEDVDVFDKEQVEWAIATRVQADKDILIIPDALGSGLEPSHNLRGVSGKMGVDATKPVGDKAFDRVSIPGFQDINLGDYF